MLHRPIHFVLFLLQKQKMLTFLVWDDLRTRYLGSFLGFAWAFIQPVATVAVLWVVTQVGFKSAPVEGHLFIFWLLSAMIPWFYFLDGISSSVPSILEKPFLVKKIQFPTHLLPVVKIAAASILHGFLLVATCLVIAIWGGGVRPSWLQLPYYFLCITLLLLALGWLTSSLVLFYRDLGQIISIALQAGFWITPIFWSVGTVPERFRFWFHLNPVFYCTEGYRSSLLGGPWFMEHPWTTLYFWSLTLVLLILGGTLFRRLRVHFADIL